MDFRKQYLHLGHSFELTEFIGGDDITIGVPFDAPDDFKKRVFAAARCYSFGNESTDYFYKRYAKHWEFERASIERRKMAAFLRACISEAGETYGEIMNGVERKNTSIGLFAAEISLARLLTTFKTAAFTLAQGFLYESASLMRLCLEQMAWAYAIRNLDDKTFFDVNPTKCIKALKDLKPNVGKFYSELSDYTHLNPKLQVQFIDASGEFIGVHHIQHENCVRFASRLGVLVDLYRVVMEAISFEFVKSPKAWETSADGKRVLLVGRPFLNEIDEYEEQINERA